MATTNRQKLAKMTNEQLAKILSGYDCQSGRQDCQYCIYKEVDCYSRDCNCVEGILQWLNQESEE